MHLITFLICKNDGTETGVFSYPIEFLSFGNIATFKHFAEKSLKTKYR